MLAGGDIDKDKVVENGEYPIYANALVNDGIVGYYDDYYRVKAPAVSVTGRGDVGHAQARMTDFTPVVRLLAIRSDHDCYFLENAINTRRIIVESTGVPQLTVPQLSSYDIFFPRKLEEEQKIGVYFHSIDNLITLHQRKYDKLVNVKKAMLEKMFPKDGADVPEIRFKGFTEAWEQRKVGELLIERNKQAPMSDDYPLMAFIANEGVAPKGDRYDRSSLVSDVSGKLYKHTEFGDFIYSSNNLESGSIGLNKYGNACISPVYSIFQSTEISDPEFIGRRFLRKDFINSMIKWRQGVIYGQWRIHESDFVKIEVIIPSLIEQKRVGKFLNQLDNLITLHQRKLLNLV